jgi:HSP20 family protein
MPDNNVTTTQGQGASSSSSRPQRSVVPAVDVFEDASGITLLADLPGVSKEQLEIRLDSDALVIEGTVAPLTPEGLQPLWAELNVPHFRRTFTLSRELDTGKIDANLRNGVLTLRIPKQADAQPRRISVNAG